MALLDPPTWAPSRLQDPFGLRTVPQVHAPFLDALATTADAVQVEADDSTENPLVTADGTPLHHGGFVTARLSAALDALRQASYPVLSLSASRLSALTNPALTGLPAFLASGPPGSSGLMILEYLTQDALARARLVTTPVSTGHANVSLGLEEHASFSTQAAWACEEMVRVAPVVLGCELVAAVRALRMQGRAPSGGPLRSAFDLAEAVLDPRVEDRPLDTDIAVAADLLPRLALLYP
jgi:histidine ammonia-lyase